MHIPESTRMQCVLYGIRSPSDLIFYLVINGYVTDLPLIGADCPYIGLHLASRRWGFYLEAPLNLKLT